MLYLMRHSRAASADFRTTDDARWLTAEGREFALRGGAALAENASIEYIVSSPLARAVQTAELVARCLNWEGPIICLEGLRSEASPQETAQELLSLPSASVLAVSHEPIISSIASILLGSNHRGFRTAEIQGIKDGAKTWSWLA